MGCLHDPANVQQTFSKCIQNTCANAGRLLDRVNTLFWWCISRGCCGCVHSGHWRFLCSARRSNV